MMIRKNMEPADFEQLITIQDRLSGLKAIIAIHNTKLGPALGGCRMWEYATEEDAVRDALRLAKGMTYKCAISGLPYGGGKAVIIGHPDKEKHDALFRSLGRYIQGLQGRYISGMDLGTTVADMDFIRMETEYVTDVSGSLGATGEFTAEMTAYGVFLGIQAALGRIYGSEQVKGRTIAVQGLGKVGYFLCRYLHRAGATIIVTDVNESRVQRAVEQFGARPVKPDTIYDEVCDVFSPCALGAVLNDDTLGRLRCKIVAGAANNQLEEERHGRLLHKRGILYAPDYVINAGGIIVTAHEINGDDAALAEQHTEGIHRTLMNVFDYAEQRQIAASAAADELTEQILQRG